MDTPQAARGPQTMLWAGRTLSTLAILFLLMDGVMKLFAPPVVVAATTQLGWAPGVIVPLGVVLLACTVLYALPRTTVLGAILLTGYLGGAVAAHVRAGDGAFPVVFPAIVGAVSWGGLVLRDGRLRALLPFTR